jgi:hypothetical protein
MRSLVKWLIFFLPVCVVVCGIDFVNQITLGELIAIGFSIGGAVFFGVAYW